MYYDTLASSCEKPSDSHFSAAARLKVLKVHRAYSGIGWEQTVTSPLPLEAGLARQGRTYRFALHAAGYFQVLCASGVFQDCSSDD